MSLSIRVARLEDLVADQAVLAHAYGSDPDLLRRLPEAWKRLFTQRSFQAGVVEDRAADGRARVVAHGATAFVSATFASELRSGHHGPTVGAQVARRVLESGEGVLTLEQMRANHAGTGLHAVALHTAYNDVPPGRFGTLEQQETLAVGYFYHHRGYRLTEYMKDVYSAFELDWFQAGGLRLRTDYREFFGDPAEEPTVERPFLVSVLREEAMARPGVRFAAMFTEHATHLGLRAIHRELLERALVGETDEEIAESLSVSPSTVKWRWGQIYALFEERLPELYRSWGEGVRMSNTRGSERRRHVLDHLRHHPEEMRPWED